LQLDKWLKQREEKIKDLEENLRTITTELNRVKNEVSELQHITMKVPIEEYIFHSPHFRIALEEATDRAMEIFKFQRDMLKANLPSLKGTVTSEKPFQTYINSEELILLAGLKTAYNGNDFALYEMAIAGKHSKPFVIDKETKQVIFLKYYTLYPDEFFELIQIEGTGTLKFSLIGASITPWSGL